MSNANGTVDMISKISEINAVKDFDPSVFVVEYTDFNNGEKRKRLPVPIQMAWFRLKYPDGRIAVTVKPISDYFVAHARVYKNFNDPVDFFLAEASVCKKPIPDKPTVSAREWAQTAAVGKALRLAGFGLQFDAAGDSFDTPAVDELGSASPPTESATPPPSGEADSQPGAVPPPAEPEALTYEIAITMEYPLSKHRGKTLGYLVQADPQALVYLSTKYKGDPRISEGARLICEHAKNTA